MEFGLNESQEILRESARQFFAGECPMSEVRRLLETETAFDQALWTKLAHQGYTGITVAEDSGGVGLGCVELILLMEEAGKALLPGPLFSTTALATGVLQQVEASALERKMLAGIASGEARGTVAFLEREASWNPADLRMGGTDGRLNGEKLFVPDAAAAQWILVAATNGLFAVRAGAPGLRIAPMRGMDPTRKFYAVHFNDAPAEKVGELAAICRGLDIATVALCAEMVGGMQRVLDLSVEYAKTRKQFGKPIGSFQAVQHLCADMYLETESARSAVYYAAWALQHGAPDASAAASIAKIYASDAGRTVGNRAIQIHGGMGFTWENDIHLYYRRAKSSETMFGDASFHRERLATQVIDSAMAAVAPA